MIGYLGSENGKWHWVDKPLEASLTWLNKFKEIDDIITQYDPTHLSLPWARVRFLLVCALARREHVEMTADSIEMTSRPVQRYRIYELTYDSETTGPDVRAILEEALVSLYAGIRRLLARVGQFLDKGTAQCSAHAVLTPEEMKNVHAAVTLLEADAEKAVSLCKSSH